jgi:hypothetical protein
MSSRTMQRLARTTRIAYSRHPVARLYRSWRRAAGDNEEIGIADVVVLPLAGLALSLYVLSIPGAGAAVAAACSAGACMP